MKKNFSKTFDDIKAFTHVGISNKVAIGLAGLLIFILVATYFIFTFDGGLTIGRAIKSRFVATISSLTYGPLVTAITIDEPTWFSTNALAPSALNFSTTKGYAPFPVFFQGHMSQPQAEIASYEWNFGDNNSYSGNPNDLKGFETAHVFEKPGTYNVTLRIKNRAGQVSSSNVTVEVLARPTATDRVYYVDPNGNDSNSGHCQVQTTQVDASGKICGPWKTAENVFYNLHNKYRFGDSVLFKRGGSYPINTIATTKVYVGGVLFGAYGEGAKPVIYYNGTTNTGIMIDTVVGSHDVAFVDLAFHFKNPAASARFGGIIRGAGQTKNFLFLRVDAEDPASQVFGFSYVSNTNPTVNEAIMTGLYVFDSSIKLNYYGQDTTSDPNFKAGDMFYGYIKNFALIGNTFDKSYGHIGYMSHLDGAVIVNNTFSRPAYGRNALRISGVLVGTRGTNNVYVADNYFLGWRDPINGGVIDNGGDVHNGGGQKYNYQLISISPNKASDQKISNVVFDRNVITNFEKAILIGDANDVIIRNNLFVSPNLSGRTTGTINIGDRTYEFRPSKNIVVANNTFVVQSPSLTSAVPSSIIYISPYNVSRGLGTEHEQIKIFNNLIYRPTNSSVNVVYLPYKTADLMKNMQFNGNLYYNKASIDGKMFMIGTTAYNLDEWQKLGYGYDANSQAQVLPLFNQSVQLPANGVGEPSILQENINQAKSYIEMFKMVDDPSNPALDNGVDLTDLVNYDFMGFERSDGSWAVGSRYDIGLFETVRKPNTPPVAKITMSDTTGFVPASIKFSAEGSTDPDGTIVSYLWKFGDGTSASSSATTHTYTAAGSYKVELLITDNRGGSGSAAETLDILVPDITKPITVASPSGGTLTSNMVQLTSDESADIFACLGTSCTPTNRGASPVGILVDVSSMLRFYSRDTAGNTEATKEALYTVPVATTACSWSCNSWSICSADTQTRTCTNTNNCGSDAGKPAESQSCTSPSDPTTPSAPANNGLTGKYFSNRTFSGNATFTRIDPVINFNWGSGAPDVIMPKDNFSARWEGKINVPTTGSYDFYVVADDGVRLWIDDKSIVDYWNVQSSVERQGKNNHLKAGQHSIRLEYFEAYTNALVRLSWSGPGISKQIIPSSSLIPF
jgi:hypothetical protein